MRRTIEVLVGSEPRKVGRIFHDIDGAREHSAFEFDARWPSENDRSSIDPALALVAGAQLRKRQIFSMRRPVLVLACALLTACVVEPPPCESHETDVLVPAGTLAFMARSETAFLYSTDDSPVFAVEVVISASHNACAEQALSEDEPNLEPQRYLSIFVNGVPKPDTYPTQVGPVPIVSFGNASAFNWVTAVDRPRRRACLQARRSCSDPSTKRQVKESVMG